MPLALSMGEQETGEERGERRVESRAESRASPPNMDISESEQSPIKSLKEGSRALSLSPGGEINFAVFIMLFLLANSPQRPTFNSDP